MKSTRNDALGSCWSHSQSAERESDTHPQGCGVQGAGCAPKPGEKGEVLSQHRIILHSVATIGMGLSCNSGKPLNHLAAELFASVPIEKEFLKRNVYK